MPPQQPPQDPYVVQAFPGQFDQAQQPVPPPTTATTAAPPGNEFAVQGFPGQAVPPPAPQMNWAMVNGKLVHVGEGGEQTPEEPDSPVVAFKSFWRQINPVNWVNGAVGMATDIGGAAVETARTGELHTPEVMKAQGRQWDEAQRRWGEGDYAGSARHYAQWLLPIIGPALDSMSDKAEAGRIWDSIGDSLGFGLAMTAPTAVATRYGPTIQAGPVMAARNPQVRAAMQEALQEGVNVDVPTATGSGFLRGAQRGAENMTLSGSLIGQRGHARTAEQAMAWGERLAQRASPQMQVPLTAGEAVVTGIERAVNRLKAETTAGYGPFDTAHTNPANIANVTVRTVRDPNTGRYVGVKRDVPLAVDVRPVKRALSRWLRTEGNFWPTLRQQASEAYAAARAIVGGDDIISAQEAERALGALKEISRGAQEVAGPGVAAAVRNPSQAIAARAVTQLQALVDQAAQRAGVLQDLQVGRALHAEKMQAVDVLKSLSKPSEHAGVFRQLVLNKDASVGKLRAVAKYAPEVMKDLARAFLEQTLEKLNEPPASPYATGLSRGQGAFRDWSNLGPVTKMLLFRDPRLVKSLDNFFIVAQQLAQNPNPSGTAYVGGGIAHLGNALLLRNPTASIWYEISGAALSRILMSPTLSRLLTQHLQLTVRNPIGSQAAASFATVTKALGTDMVPVRSPVPAMAGTEKRE